MTDIVTLGDRELVQAILQAEEQAAIHARMAKAAKEELLHRRRNAIAEAHAAKGPAEYIESKLTVKESKFKAWPSDLKAKFEPARTVKAASPSLAITPAVAG